MLRQQARLFRNVTISLDILVVLFAFLLAHSFRGMVGGGGENPEYALVLLIVFPIWFGLFACFNLYSSLRTRSMSNVLSAVVKIHFAGAIAASSLLYLTAHLGSSRIFFGYFVLISLVLICIEKGSVKLFLSAIRKRGYNFRHILIIGDNERAQRFARLVEEHAGWGLRIVGNPPLGEARNIAEICATHAVDEVVFCLPKEQTVVVDDLRQILQHMGITVHLVPDPTVFLPLRDELSYFHDEIPMFTYYGRPFDVGQLFLKRCLDVAGSLAGLGLTAFLFPFIALAIRLDSPGPLFFRQVRVGENGRLFTCWKFRSMYRDAERQRNGLISLNEMSGALFKIRNDPRVTRIGKFLRRTSLDELPQFWNVLRGEMSLVGTRPPTPEEVAGYEYKHRKRICIKPGITGLWQVSGRNEIRNFDEVVRLDIAYIDQWSLWLDVKILMKTFRVLLARNGAY
jgi:exopolysaccharide biosynthesis polyprenyl glycosylphosphotransferase